MELPENFNDDLRTILMNGVNDPNIVDGMIAAINDLLSEGGVEASPEAQAMSRKVTAALNPAMKTYCARHNIKDPRSFAANWVKSNGALAFTI